MAKVARIPDCHPDRKHEGKGLCYDCYRAAWRAKKTEGKGIRAACHPEKKHYAKGMCRACYKTEYLKTRDPSLTEKERETAAEYRKKNAEKYREWHRKATKKWADANIDRVRKASRRWRIANRERMKEASRRWRENNRERMRFLIQRRRARLNDSSSPGVPVEVFLKMCEEADWRCRYCMKKCDKPEREHVVPISRGGRDEESNVIPVCSFCNKSKNDRLLSEWLDVRLDLLK